MEEKNALNLFSETAQVFDTKKKKLKKLAQPLKYRSETHISNFFT